MSENIQTPSKVTDVKIEAKIKQSDESIVIRYSITNGSGKTIYVLDAYPAVNTQSREAYVEATAFYLCKRGADTAYILRGIPPLPIFPVAVRVMPLGTKVSPGASVEHEFTVPTPMRERNDWYYSPAPIEEHELISVKNLVFAVQIFREGVDGFHAEPVEYGPRYFTVGGSSTVKQAESLEVGIDVKPVQLFVRKDIFTRL